MHFHHAPADAYGSVRRGESIVTTRKEARWLLLITARKKVLAAHVEVAARGRANVVYRCCAATDTLPPLQLAAKRGMLW
eukprot:6172534-Pleurochrysis_carterae.AAC.4